MTALLFFLAVVAAGLGGYALLARLGLDDIESWSLGRTAGLVMAALPAWWLGVVGVSAWRIAGGVVLIVVAAWGAFELWRRRPSWRRLVAGEAIFLVSALLVLFIRLDHPQVVNQEKPMDMGILASLLRAEGFPPPDMWLAGETLPYYYWGALIWTIPIAGSGVPLEYAYNLVVALIGGMVAAALWMVGRRLAGSHWGGLLAAFFGLFAGTPDAVRQLLGGTGIGDIDIWRSSRQHADAITEFPLFTIWHGDLHPHLLAMPIAGLACLVAWHAGRRGPTAATTVTLAALFGVTWAANPWAMPPTFTAIALLMLTADGHWYWPVGDGIRRWLAIAIVAVGGWLLTAPFHLSFQPFFQGIRPVFAWTAPLTLLLYAGCLLLPTFGATMMLLRKQLKKVSLPAATSAVAAIVLLVAAVTGKPTLVILAAMLTVLTLALLGREQYTERPAVALAALGVFLFLVPEILYVADNYGDRLHRMNTVFKCYVQASTLLAMALPVMVMLSSRRRIVRGAMIALMVLVALPHPTRMVLNQFSAKALGLDGLAWMSPGDRALVDELREQPRGTTLIEAVGRPYSEFARLSANSGVPAYLGWENHELVWRTQSIVPTTQQRTALVNELYRCGDAERVRELVAEAGVDLVAIGSLERAGFPAQALQAVIDAGEIIFEEDGTLLLRFTREAASMHGASTP